MIFTNEAEALKWLSDACIKFSTETTQGSTGMTRWTFETQREDYCSIPKPISRPQYIGIDIRPKQDGERIEQHKPKTFLDAVNMFAEHLRIASVKDFSDNE